MKNISHVIQNHKVTITSLSIESLLLIYKNIYY